MLADGVDVSAASEQIADPGSDLCDDRRLSRLAGTPAVSLRATVCGLV